MISVIIPVYNQGDKLKQALQSLENQTCQDLELIIINDGSTDDTQKIIEDYIPPMKEKGMRIRVFIHKTNKGAPAARNQGYRAASGEYLFFCDADAILKPHALEKMLNTLEQAPDASYVYPSFKWGGKVFRVGPFDKEKLKQGPYIHTMGLIRKEDFPESGWDEDITKLQDWDLWLTMLEQEKIGYWIDEILFTIQPGGTMSSWVPSFAYKLLPFLPSVKKYNQAVEKIKQKHNLEEKK